MILVVAMAGLGAPAPRTGAMPAAPRQDLADRLLPRPQYLEARGGGVRLDDSWRFAVDTTDPAFAFAATWFNDKVKATAPLTLSVVDGAADAGGARRVVVGDPARHSFVRAALVRVGKALPNALGTEGYVLAVAGGVAPEVVIGANTPNGAFYGVTTLLQLIAADGAVPGVFVVDYPSQAVRGTYEPTNAVFGWQDGRNAFTDRQRAFIDWLAARKFNTLFLVDNGDFFAPESTWVDAYRELFAYARARFIEPVPRICSISTVAPFPFALYEGWSIADEPFTFGADDRAVPERPFVDLLTNGDFEADADGDGKPDGWSVTNVPGAAWSLDPAEAAHGARSMRLDIPVPAARSSSAILSARVQDVVPDSYYCAWGKARGTGIADVQAQLTLYATNGARQVSALQSDITWSTSGWIDFGTCVQTPADPIALTLYARIQNPGRGTFWLDDVHLYRVDGGLRNVIRAPDTDIAVTDATGAIRYALGQDYAVEDGQTGMRFLPTFRPFQVRRLPGGRLAPGQTVRLSYDAYLFVRQTQYWQSAPCVACEALYTDYYEPAIAKVIATVHPKILNIDADEIRGFYRDSRMVRRFASNAEAIAYWANRIRAFTATRAPAVRLWIWDDMVSPYHNGGVTDYQVHYGGRPGRMAEATERDWLDRSVLMDVWWYDDGWLSQMWQSVDYFTRKGYEVLGSPWLDAGNIASWSEILVDRPGALGGVETNWGTPYETAHATFADHFWHTRHRLALFDSFESDDDGNGLPAGWRATGPITYSTDGSMAHGHRYAGFPNAALGFVTDTVRVASVPIAVRPQTDYVLSAYLKRAAWADPASRLRLAWLDARQAELGAAETMVPSLGEAYAEATLAATTPAGAAFAVIAVDGPAAGMWLDTVRLKEATGFFGIVAPDGLPAGVQGRPYAAVLSAAGGALPYRWELASGALPGGMLLTADGSLRGTPRRDGVFALTVRATDAAGRTDERAYELVVLPPAEPPVLCLPWVSSGRGGP